MPQATAGTYKGYNDFPDLLTYVFEYTGVNCGSAFIPQYYTFKCTQIGTSFNFLVWCRDHEDLLGNVSEDLPEPIKMYDGIYMTQFYIDPNPSTPGMTEYIVEVTVPDYLIVDKPAGETETYTDGKMTYHIYPPLSLHGSASMALGLFYTYPYQGDPTDISPVFAFFQDIGCGCRSWSGTLSDFPSMGGYLKQWDGNMTGPWDNVAIWEVDISTDDQTTWYTFGSEVHYNYYMYYWGGEAITDPDDDPEEGDDGGGGSYGQEPTDPVPIDGVPSVSAISSGFVKMYNPSGGQLQSLANYMYSDNFIDNVKKLMNDPLQYVIALMLNAATPTTSASVNIRVGGLDSGVSAPPIGSQYNIVNCGSFNVEESYGSFLDYDNYTNVRMFLPFCGELSLDTNIVMKSTVNLQYTFDFLTGNCLARVHVKNNKGTNAEVYELEGNCSCQIPMSGSNYMSFFTQGVRALAGLGRAAGGDISGVFDSAAAVASMHVERERVGGITGSHGMIGNYVPYIMIERPKQSLANNYKQLEGRPSNVGGKISSWDGYAEFDYVKFNGSGQATKEELEEIRQLLASGVYV